MTTDVKPRWAWHATYAVPLLITLFAGAAPVYRQLFPTNLISQKDANDRAQLEIEEMARLFMQQPEGEYPFIDDRRGRLIVRVYADESMVQYRKYPDGHERTRFIPSLSIDRHVRGLDPNVETAALEQQSRCDYVRHGEPFVQQVVRGSCAVDLYLSWNDGPNGQGCQAARWYNPCRSEFGPLNWTRCLH